MIVSRRDFLAAAAAAAPLGTAALQAPQPAPPVQPLGKREALKLGDDRDGYAYIPKDYEAAGAPLPLLFMLHGAGNTSLSVQYSLPLADEFGVIIIAPDSRDERTWDGVLRNWGPDVDFIAAAIGHVSRLCHVDRERVTVAGFSDGASYSLSFGISYGDVFSRVISMSPGVMQPMAARGKPKIFISHGTNDAVMPIDETSRRFVPRLKSLGYDVTYREYEGTHRPSPPIVREAFEWAMR